MKILIADDDKMTRRLLQKTLEWAGYEVTSVENGRLALQQLSLQDGPRPACGTDAQSHAPIAFLKPYPVHLRITCGLTVFRELGDSCRAGLEIGSGKDELQRPETLRPQSAWASQ